MLASLYYLSSNATGGWTTFTAHLHRALKKNGIKAKLYKITKTTENRSREFGYDLEYNNLCPKDAYKKCKKHPALIVALQKNYLDHARELVKRGARIVIHDPTELRNRDFRDFILENGDRVVVIRQGNLQHIHNATFIPHPYVRLYKSDAPPTCEYNAVSISRIDFDKNLDWLLEANRRLKERSKIHIRGFENRIYTRFNIVPKYPEWTQSIAHYPREMRFATRLCHKARFMVDMSFIKGDGGGTQYTFLEAIDAGAVCVLNEGWLTPSGVMQNGENCIAVPDWEGLVKVLKRKDKAGDLPEIRANARKILSNHSPEVVGKQYVDVLKRS